MTHVTCRLTAKNRDQLRNPTLGNRVWATLFYPTLCYKEFVVPPEMKAFFLCMLLDILGLCMIGILKISPQVDRGLGWRKLVIMSHPMYSEASLGVTGWLFNGTVENMDFLFAFSSNCNVRILHHFVSTVMVKNSWFSLILVIFTVAYVALVWSDAIRV